MRGLPKLIVLFLLVMIFSAATHASETRQDSAAAADVKTVQPALSGPSGNKPNIAENRPDTKQSSQAVADYQKSIAKLQQDHGAFYDQISEELVGMGLAYRNLGQNDEAIQAFNRSLHINRINHGLYDASQLPILELIISTNTALADWQALDDNYHYLYWVCRRIYGSDDPRLLPVIDRVGRWHLKAYNLAMDPIPFKHLLAANQLFQDAVQIIDTNFGPDDPRLLKPLYGLVMADYQIAARARNVVNFGARRIGSTNPDFMGQNLQNQINQELDEWQAQVSDSYHVGKQAILKIIDIYSKNSNVPTDAPGKALIMLGDWYLLFDRRADARNTYAMAWSNLQESGMQKADIDRLFGRPHSLPALQLPTDYQSPADKNNANGDYVIAKFDVSKSGRARNIEIVESNPADNEPLMRRVKDTIRATRFRPRLENGQPVATAGVNIKYIDHE